LHSDTGTMLRDSGALTAVAPLVPAPITTKDSPRQVATRDRLMGRIKTSTNMPKVAGPGVRNPSGDMPGAIVSRSFAGIVGSRSTNPHISGKCLLSRISRADQGDSGPFPRGGCAVRAEDSTALQRNLRPPRSFPRREESAKRPKVSTDARSLFSTQYCRAPPPKARRQNTRTAHPSHRTPTEHHPE